MENMSLAELIALFGEEVGTNIYNEQNQSSGSSFAYPFPLLKKVVDSDLGIGKFGEFVFGTEFEKEGDDRVVTNPGTNVGSSLTIVPVTEYYRFKKWDESVKKTAWSNMFKEFTEAGLATDNKGNRIPDNKEVRKELGWKTVKVIGCLVKVGDTFEPVVLEVDGKLYATYLEFCKTAVNSGKVLQSMLNIVTKTEKQGATKFTVIDVAKSTSEALPISFITDNKDAIGAISLQMAEYAKSSKSSSATSNTTAGSTVKQDETPAAEDNTDW